MEIISVDFPIQHETHVHNSYFMQVQTYDSDRCESFIEDPAGVVMIVCREPAPMGAIVLTATPMFTSTATLSGCWNFDKMVLQRQVGDYLQRCHCVGLQPRSKPEHLMAGGVELLGKYIRRYSLTLPLDGLRRKLCTYTVLQSLRHACDPNCSYTIDPETQQLVIRVLKPMQRGDRVSINYLAPSPTRLTRARRLELQGAFSAQYEIVCACAVCQEDLAAEFPHAL